MLFTEVYNAANKIAHLWRDVLLDLDLLGTCKAIDSVATGSIPSLFCGII